MKLSKGQMRAFFKKKKKKKKEILQKKLLCSNMRGRLFWFILRSFVFLIIVSLYIPKLLEVPQCLIHPHLYLSNFNECLGHEYCMS